MSRDQRIAPLVLLAAIGCVAASAVTSPAPAAIALAAAGFVLLLAFVVLNDRRPRS